MNQDKSELKGEHSSPSTGTEQTPHPQGAVDLPSSEGRKDQVTDKQGEEATKQTVADEGAE